MEKIDHIRLSEDDNSLIILDQTQLPNREEYLELRTPEEMFRAIKRLEVRGAPAIGIFAGFSMYVLARGFSGLSYPMRRQTISTPPGRRRSI